MNKNDVFQLEVLDYTSEGLGVCKVDGRVIFVKSAVKGDLIDVKIVKMTKNVAFGIIVDVVKPSPNRMKPKCYVAKKCGGCQLWHMSYEEELEFKRKKVEDALTRIGKIDVNITNCIPSDLVERYRNKAQYPFANENGQAIYGFYRNNSHDIVENNNCLIQTEKSNEIVAEIKAFLNEFSIKAYSEDKHNGLVRNVYVRTGFKTGEILVTIVSRKNALPKLEILRARLLEKFPKIVGILLNINPEKTNVILGEETQIIHGRDYILDELCGNEIKISMKSFYQVNRMSAEKLYEKAIEFADFKGTETVLDLYCGVGAITLAVAPKVEKIIGVEVVDEAINNANFNAENNNITNVEFICAESKQFVDKISAENIDVIIVDPPRKGLDSETLDSMAEINPKKIVYVSCDPGTLARDIKLFVENGYKVTQSQAFDLFPRTSHVETVCLLSKLKSDHHIEVKLDMNELDLTSAESKATYDEIKGYVLENSGLKVSSLYIAQVKEKMGIKERENFNVSKKDDAKVPVCPADKEKAIVEALEHFNMIG